METMQELIPLAKELMAQKPGRKLVKLYVLGSVLAFLGAVLGLVETVCSPFAAASRLREREAALAALRDARPPPGPRPQALWEKGALEAAPGSRALAHRQHAS
ncbi:G0/G1 switch protein 2 [Galemys pyrenaicus]|uniref:G0/G1 switch protein 2 n=1 Tax=Galemys pyrenaicus TaxID=202257 RepID=A0A8J5ZMV0_GALPY|nr:G0/G1 switch protein 2 [Galemys pyrenaicus]